MSYSPDSITIIDFPAKLRLSVTSTGSNSVTNTSFQLWIKDIMKYGKIFKGDFIYTGLTADAINNSWIEDYDPSRKERANAIHNDT